MAKFKIGIGSSVEIGKINGANTTYTILEGVKTIALPNSTTDEVEVTSFDSPDGYKEYISGLKDNGEVSIDMNWQPESATDTILSSVKSTGETVTIRYKIKGSANTTANSIFTVSYSGFCKGYERAITPGEAGTATATFRISGTV